MNPEQYIILKTALDLIADAGSRGLDDVGHCKEIARSALASAAQLEMPPVSRDVGRAEDMGQGHMRVLLDSENDVVVEAFDGLRSTRVEFCNPGGGGGRSPRTRSALIDLMRAMEADNAETPSLQRPSPPLTNNATNPQNHQRTIQVES